MFEVSTYDLRTNADTFGILTIRPSVFITCIDCIDVCTMQLTSEVHYYLLKNIKKLISLLVL